MAKIADDIDAELQRWLSDRPKVIRDMAASHPPDRLYRLKTTGHRVTILAYSENRTVRVNVSGRYNFLSHERNVFGISIDDLEECDLPSDDEQLGSVLDKAEFEAAIAAGKTREERLDAVRVAAEKKIFDSLQIESPVNVEDEAPLFKHDCNRCVYLGRLTSGATFDLYFCMQSGGMPTTVIARYGDEGPHYHSGLTLVDSMPTLAEAKRRAQARGLLK